jgi:hypothetical protein
MKVLNSPPIVISAGVIFTLAGFAGAGVGNAPLPDEKQFVNSVGIKLVQDLGAGKGEVLLDHMDIADMRLPFKKTSV